MMTISFSCEFCRKSYTVDGKLAGKRARCKECGHEFRIPTSTLLKAAEVEDPFGLADPYGLDELPAYRPVAQDEEFVAPPPRFPKSPKAKETWRPGAPGSVMPRVAGAMFLVALLLLAGTFAAAAAGSRSVADVCLGLTILIAVVNLAVAGIWQLVLPFQESIACGLMFLFVPFYALYYTITRWETMKGPLLAGCGSILIVAGLGVVGPLLNQRLPRNAPAVAAAPAPPHHAGALPMPPAPPGFGPGFDPLGAIRRHQEQVRQWQQGMDQFTQQKEQELLTQYGDRAITITVSGLPPGDSDASAFVLDQIKAALGPKISWFSTSRDDVLVLVAGPIDHPDAVAAKLTFGRVEHPSRGVINVAADMERIPKAPQVPADADPITRALAELQRHDQNKRREAIERLGRRRVDAKRQAEVARALEAQLQEPDGFTRIAAIKALAIWGDSDSVSALIATLRHDDVFTRAEAIKALAGLRDERAIEPIARRFLELEDRAAARGALQAFGEAAEPAVLELLQHPDVFVRTDACQVLKVIGTRASSPALRQVVRAGGLPAMAAREALQALGADR